MRKYLAIAALTISALATNAYAIGEARISGKVVDAQGQPLADVQISISAATKAKNFSTKTTTNKKGQFSAFLLDGTIQYKFVFAKEGFATYEETMKLKLVPEKNEKTVTLNSGSATGTVTEVTVPAAAAKPDPGVVAYNEGVTLVNEGKVAEAIQKFETAVATKPELSQAHAILAKLYVREKKYAKAIESANKALAINDDGSLNGVLAEAYEKSGDKVKAAEYKKKAPANPSSLFNEAARLINSGKDADAEALLKQAVVADEKFAPAHYELGMIYVRAGKNSDARKHLQKYLEIEPNGKDAATAKEMLNYVK